MFLHEPFSPWVVFFFSELKNIRQVASCIVVSLIAIEARSCKWVPSQSFSSFTIYFFNIVMWHLLVNVKCYRLLSSWKVTLLSQNKIVKLLSGSRNECL